MTARRWLRSAVLAVATAVALPAIVHAQPADTSAQQPAESALKDLQQQELTLNDRSATAVQREQAARRLVSRPGAETDAILLRVLSDLSHRDGQLGVARALGSDPTPEPRFIDPLGYLLGDDLALTEAASQALTIFKSEDRAREKLTRFVNDGRWSPRSRAVAVKAMGRLVDKQAAQALIDILDPRRDENSLIRDAAMEGLSAMTGLRGQDAQGWLTWWERNKDKREVDWVSDLLNKNSGRADELDKRLTKLRGAAVQMIREDYTDARAPEAERVKKLVGYLKTDSEDVRLAAVQIVHDEAVQFGGARIPSEVLAELRSMVGDSAPELRSQVARTLSIANDTAAVAALLTQLEQEKDPTVQAAILQALGPTHDLRVVEPLLLRLNDGTFSVAAAAADALRDLAPKLREENGAMADKVAQQLGQRLQQTHRNIQAQRLRESIVEALARLGHRSQLHLFYGLLDPNVESTNVRRAALRGLGLIGNADSANYIVQALEDPQPTVRYQAADALATTASFAHAKSLGQRLYERTEPDKGVRDKAWEVLTLLFEKATERELDLWARQFAGPSPEDLARRATVLEVWEEKIVASESDERRKDLAAVRQNLGETLLKLDRPQEAVPRFQQALGYWLSANAQESVIHLPRQQLMEALLRARQYSEFVEFAKGWVDKDQRVLTDVFVSVNNEVKRLRNSRDLDGALKLVDQVRPITWGNYAAQLQRMGDDLRREKNTGGWIWVRQYQLLQNASIPGSSA